jgi:hypothetical protein
MHSLRDSAINLCNSGISAFPFYRNSTIEARLIKSNSFNFILTIKNLSTKTVRIGYVDQSKARFSNRIKILNWGNSKNPGIYELGSQAYLDIKFTFQTYDFNFKFLLFLLEVNE